LDIGTGTGLLAILAAKMGGIVNATDILQSAVSLARENSILNQVSVDVRLGDIFAPFNEAHFDVIIANVPQELLSPKIKKKWDRDKIISYSGGDDGTEVLLNTLEQAPKHMNPDSRLYCVVYTMTNYRKTLKYISKNFSVKLINFYSGAVKDFIYEDLDWYESNRDIQIYKVGDKYFADLFTFELVLKHAQE
jgi:release factor glutamine methyltransferase